MYEIPELYNYTKENSERINEEPTDLLSMQNSLKFYEELMSEIAKKETEFPSIQDHFSVLDKYEIAISSGVRNMLNNLNSQWKWYLDKLKEAEEMLDNSKDTFKLGLLEEAEELKKEAKKLLDSFAEKAPFSSAV